MLKNAPILCAIALMSITPVTQAGFDIIRDDELESNPGKYGNAHTVPFQKAMQGDNSVSVNEDKPLSDSSALATEVPKIGHTWFISTHLGRPHAKMKDITISNANGIATTQSKTTESDYLFNFSLAWGYRWINWAWDAELLLTEGMDVNMNITTGGTTYGSNNTVDNYVVFLNLHYYFSSLFGWKPHLLTPHLGLGFGPNIQRAKADLLLANQSISSKSKTNLRLAWNFTLGLAYHVTNNFSVDLSWRYIDFDKAKFGPVGTGGVSEEISSNKFSSNGLYFGLIYEMD